MFGLTVLARLQAGSRFRAFATAFPPFRPIARRRARAVFDLCAGFVYAQTLLALAQLDIPRILLRAPQRADTLASLLALPADRVERLLLAGMSLRLIRRRRDGRFSPGPLGLALIDNPGVSAMIAHHALLYDDLRDPVSLLRAGAGSLADYWRYDRDAPAGRVEPYTALMRASQPMIASEILAAYALRRHRLLLDVGGGSGRFVQEALQRAPQLRAMLFDLPAVAEQARHAFESAGLSARARVVGGDFHADALPTGADLVSLVRVLHDHDDDAALSLLRRIRAVLAPGGTLLLAEPMSGTRGALPAGDAYFGWYLLAMGSGRPRTARRIAAMLAEAGFGRIRTRRTRLPMLVRVIVARSI